MVPERLRWRVLVVALCALLAGCDDGVTELKLQAVADPVEARAYRDMIAAFERQHDDVRVEFVPVSSQRDHMARLTLALAGGVAPDLFLINFRRYGQYIANRAVKPMGPLLERHGGFDPQAFYAPPLEAFTHDGELQCMPQNVSSLVVYWNRGLFRQYAVPPPRKDWTWKQFHDTALALALDETGRPRKDIAGLDFDPSIIRLAPFVWQAGGELVDDMENPSRFTLKTQEAVIGLIFLKRLRTHGRVMPSLAQRRAQGPDARFAAGGLGMTLQSRRYTAALRAIPDLDWDVAPLPRYQNAATVLHSDAYCLSVTSEADEAASRFVRFATSAEGQRLLSASGRIVPARREVAESEAFLDPHQAPASAQVFLDGIAHMRRTPRTLRWYEIETRIDPIIEEWMFETAAAAESAMGDGYRLAVMIEQAAAALLESGE